MSIKSPTGVHWCLNHNCWQFYCVYHFISVRENVIVNSTFRCWVLSFFDKTTIALMEMNIFVCFFCIYFDNKTKNWVWKNLSKLTELQIEITHWRRINNNTIKQREKNERVRLFIRLNAVDFVDYLLVHNDKQSRVKTRLLREHWHTCPKP